MKIYGFDILLPNLEPVYCSMISPNCCFLTCIQISQEVGQVVWHSHLLKNFPQFVVIYTVKGFGIVNKAEVDVFLELSCFLEDPADIGNLISGSSVFLKFTVHILLKHGLDSFECYFVSVWDECNCAVVWTFLTLPFFGIEMETDLFQSCGHCWVFQVCWRIECSTFTASSFRIWNSSIEFLSSWTIAPLALFLVMLPKALLISYSGISGSRWVITPSWLSESCRSILYSSVYSYQLFLISSASVRSIAFLSFIVHIFAWNGPMVSLILLMRSLVFPILLFSSISLHESLRKVFLSLLASLWNLTFKCVYLFVFVICLSLFFFS